jgi:hypothetical protein
MQIESVDHLKQQNKALSDEVERLKDIILLLNREKFGPKSEQISPDQLIFNEIEVEATTLPEPDTETITYTRNKGKQAKKPYPEHLDREEVIIDLTEAQKICPYDGARLKEIGVNITEKIKTVPAQSTSSNNPVHSI